MRNEDIKVTNFLLVIKPCPPHNSNTEGRVSPIV
jgi:hypothetical protein